MKPKVKNWLKLIESGELKNKSVRVLHFIITHPHTDLDCMRNSLNLPHQTCSAILSTMMDYGLVKGVGERQKNGLHYSQLMFVENEQERDILAFRREQEKFIETIEQSGDEVFADMMTWAFHTGMRHSTELNKFTIHNINFVNHTIQFYREKTKKMSVVFPLSKRCIEIAKKYREVALAREDGKVFPFGKQYIRTRWAKYVKECGLNNTYTPYVTRHTFITRLVEEGVSDRVISDLAGHTCMETTSKYYKKSTSKLLTNAVLSLDNARDEYLVSKNSMIGHNSKKRKVENE